MGGTENVWGIQQIAERTKKPIIPEQAENFWRCGTVRLGKYAAAYKSREQFSMSVAGPTPWMS